jgi:hypothetical protein
MIPIPTAEARRVALYVPSCPSELCDLLKIGYSARQHDLMAHLARARGAQDVRLEDPDWTGDPLRAAAMAVLWRVLGVPGTRASVIAPDGSELGRLFMDFLAEVSVTRDVCLRSVTNVRDWNRLEFDGGAGWEIRLVPNVPVMAAEAARRSLIGVVVDAGSAEPRFVEALRELEAVVREPKGLLIRLW